jgi:AAA15 family ATPase/GTPase
MFLLKEIAISGFKGVKDRVVIIPRQFNVIVGQHDAGKSTILKSLDLFLNNRVYLPENLNNQTSKNTVIELLFDPNNTQIIIDENVSTTFENEELVNERGLLHIKKVWDGTKTGRITPETFVVRKSYKDYDYFTLSETQLIRLCKDKGLDAEPGLMTNPQTGKEHNNAEKRSRLKDVYKNQSIEFEYIEEKLPTSGTSRLKKTEIAIRDNLPRFEYFHADSPLSESDNTIQRYFRDLAFKAISDDVDTSELESSVEGKLQLVLDTITEKINAVVPEKEKVKAKVTFDWTKLTSTEFESASDLGAVPLSSRGDGFRRITMMAYFECLAEQNHEEHQSIIFGFEEPETFLHPSAQENLFDRLFDLSENEYQVIVTTHSPVIVSRTQTTDIHHVYKENGTFTYLPDVEDIKSVATDLGVTVDNQFVALFEKAKCLLLLEGIDDCNAIDHAVKLYKENGLIEYNFSELCIVSIPVGGCGSIKHWVSLDLLKSLGKPFFIYFDSDKTAPEMESPNAQKLISLGFTEGKDFFVCRKRELENYIVPEAICKIVPESHLSYTDYCDVKKMCKSNQYAGKLGGKNVAERHFCSLSFEDLQKAFDPNNNDDELLQLYNALCVTIGIET